MIFFPYSTSKILTLVLIFFCTLYSLKSISQTDTLHLYYQGLLTKTLDSNEAKIGAWAKSLKGKHVDVDVLAYYEKTEYKKYSQERCDELFLVLKRKARDLITIKTNEPKKGAKSQRSKVDIVYSYGNSELTDVAATNENNTGNANSEVTKTNNSGSASTKSNIPSDSKKNSETKTSSNQKVVENDNSNNYIYDSVYVNGKLKITKRKIKKKQ